MTWQKSLRSRGLAKIGQIAYPPRYLKGLDIEILWYQFGKLSKKNREELGFKRFLTFDLYLGQVKGQRKISNTKNVQGREPSIMVWMNFAHLFLGLHNSYIHLSIFSLIFCHISMTACHMISKMMIWAIGPMAYVPTKFHWDSFNRRVKSDQFNYYYADNN